MNKQSIRELAEAKGFVLDFESIDVLNFTNGSEQKFMSFLVPEGGMQGKAFMFTARQELGNDIEDTFDKYSEMFLSMNGLGLAIQESDISTESGEIFYSNGEYEGIVRIEAHESGEILVEFYIVNGNYFSELPTLE